MNYTELMLSSGTDLAQRGPDVELVSGELPVWVQRQLVLAEAGQRRVLAPQPQPRRGRLSLYPHRRRSDWAENICKS